MKNLICLFLILLNGFSLKSQTMYPSGVAGCVARWDFTSNPNLLLDQSGNGNHSFPVSIYPTTGWRNFSNTAGLFNGFSSKAECPHSSTLNLTTFTIISLVKFNDFYSGTCNASQIVSKGYPYFIAGNYGMCVQDNYYDGDCNIFSPNNMQSSIQSATQSNSPTAGNYIQKNKWYFIAVTFDNNQMQHYQLEMDSTNKASFIAPLQTVPSSGPLGSNGQNLSIGFHLNPQYPYWLNGKMDELVIFNRVLIPEEIYSVYDYLYQSPTTATDIATNNSFKIVRNDGFIRIYSETSDLNYTLRTMAGQIILEKKNAKQFEEINIESFANQLLILELYNGKQRLIKKI